MVRYFKNLLSFNIIHPHLRDVVKYLEDRGIWNSNFKKSKANVTGQVNGKDDIWNKSSS